jgi:hypothetical protein
MTAITAIPYASYASLTGAGSAAAKPASTATADGTSAGAENATTITLSEAAKAALSEKDLPTVVAETRAALDNLLSEAGLTSPLKEGKLAIDLSSFDRRALFAIVANSESEFTEDERSAAAKELVARFDAALVGALAVARVTGDLTDLYKAAIAYLDAASPEEKASAAWIEQRAAAVEAQKQLLDDPSELPAIENDPVSDYIARAALGETGKLRDFADVAVDARTALDKQYASAAANGKELVFNKARKTGQLVDLAQFSSRALSAIALDEGSKFNAEEVFAAKAEMRSRSGSALVAGLKDAASGSDPTAFAKNIISAYASMSSEERAAAGWSESFYAAALQNYQSSAEIAKMLAGTGSSGMSLLDFI